MTFLRKGDGKSPGTYRSTGVGLFDALICCPNCGSFRMVVKVETRYTCQKADCDFSDEVVLEGFSG